MKVLPILVAMGGVAGCFTSVPPMPVYWDLSARNVAATAVPSDRAQISPSVRLTSLEIRQPCDRVNFCVRRSDAVWAFDELNLFTDSPQTLLRNMTEAILPSTGRFGIVVPSASAAEAACSLEVLVEDLSLGRDPKASGTMAAHASVALRLVRGQSIIGTGRGEATAEVTDGNYARAYSTAYAKALGQAVNAL